MTELTEIWKKENVRRQFVLWFLCTELNFVMKRDANFPKLFSSCYLHNNNKINVLKKRFIFHLSIHLQHLAEH